MKELEEKPNIIQWKNINVKLGTWKRLTKLRVEKNYRSIDELINKLLE